MNLNNSPEKLAQAQQILKEKGFDKAKTIMLPTLPPAKQKRLNLCGSFAIRINPSTGLPYRIRYKCKLWREGCPLCLEERRIEFHKRALELEKSVTGEVRIVQRSKKDMNKLLRQLHTTGLRR